MSDFQKLADAFFAAANAAEPTTIGGVSMELMRDPRYSQHMFNVNEQAVAQEHADRSTARVLRSIAAVYAGLAKAETA